MTLGIDSAKPRTTENTSKTRASRSVQPSRNLSTYESQFLNAIEDLKAGILTLQEQRFVDLDFEAKVEQFTTAKNNIYTASVEIGDEIGKRKDLVVFLLSRKEDTQRLVDKTLQFVRHKAEDDEILQNLPLDAESESFRRRLAVEAIMATKLVGLMENSIGMMSGSCCRVDETWG